MGLELSFGKQTWAAVEYLNNPLPVRFSI